MSEELNNQILYKIKEIGIDLLENSNLLENTIKELYVSQLIENIKIDDKEFELFFKN